jgi:hypothetical protein
MEPEGLERVLGHDERRAGAVWPVVSEICPRGSYSLQLPVAVKIV